MELQLTPDEQKYLIWKPGDTYEIVAGEIHFTARGRLQPGDAGEETDGAEIPSVNFFFQSSTGRWGTQEWSAFIGADIHDGPALMVLCVRDNKARVFGLVSMINGAWGHWWPFMTFPFWKKSSKARKRYLAGQLEILFGIFFPVALVCSFVGMVGKSIWGYVGAGYVVFFLTYLLCTRMYVSRHLTNFVHGYDREATKKAARGLMYRIAKNAQSYWPNNPGTGGRL